MEDTSYKNFGTARGFNYHYYYTPPEDPTLPFLLFLHGFPTTSASWRHQVPYFRRQGFGLIIPDMLGFGESSKPTDPEAYRLSLICQDMVELLDAENIGQAIVIGHDLSVLTRLSYRAGPTNSDFAPQRVEACISSRKFP